MTSMLLAVTAKRFISTSGSVVTKVAIPAPQKSNFRVAFAPERMAMNMTTDPLVGQVTGSQH